MLIAAGWPLCWGDVCEPCIHYASPKDHESTRQVASVYTWHYRAFWAFCEQAWGMECYLVIINVNWPVVSWQFSYLKDLEADFWLWILLVMGLEDSQVLTCLYLVTLVTIVCMLFPCWFMWIQVCNAYTELNDPVIQRERFADQVKVAFGPCLCLIIFASGVWRPVHSKIQSACWLSTGIFDFWLIRPVGFG